MVPNPMNKCMIWGFSHIFWKHTNSIMVSKAGFFSWLKDGDGKARERVKGGFP